MTNSEDTVPAGRPGAAPRRLGTLLVERGLLTAAQLEEALLEQQRAGVPLGQTVVRLGYVSPAAVAQALATQQGGLAKTEFGMALGFDTTLARVAGGVPPVSSHGAPTLDAPSADLEAALRFAEGRLDVMAEEMLAAARRIVEAELGRDRARALASALEVRVAELEAENERLRAQAAEAARQCA